MHLSAKLQCCVFAHMMLLPAASDGLAVGAASLASEPAVSLGVAAAMVVHKGPVAVGLAAYLRSARWTPSRVHKGEPV
jgi:zinc transporter 9